MTSKNLKLSSKTDQHVNENLGSIIGTQFNIGVSEAKAPTRTVVASYLQSLIATIGPERKYDTSRLAAELTAEPGPQQPKADKLHQKRVEALRRLWQQDFYVRRLGQTEVSRRLLKQATQDLLDSKRPAGVMRRAVALLSDAGVGKTPALQYTLLQIAEKSLPHYQTPEAEVDQDSYALIPLLIPLAELRSDQPFLTLVRAAFNHYAPEPITLDQADLLLQEYDCLLQLDDLDKVAYGASSGGIKIIREFMDNYPQERYLISCRTNGYHEQLGPMEAFVLEELSDEQVKDVLADEHDERLLPLARNRSMLKIMITEGQQDSVRWSRGRLLKRMIWVQLGRRETEADSQQEMVEALLERLAFRMHQDRVYRYSEQQLMEFITSHLAEWHEPYTWREVTQRFRRHEVMISDERRQWRFLNRSTQAYFVAAAIYRNPALQSSALENASDFWWREPLEILVGLLDEPSQLLFELIDRDALVATHCFQFVGQPVEQRVVDSLIDALVERMRYERAPGRAQLIRLVSKTGYLPPQNLLWQLLYREQKSLVLMALARALTDANLRRTQYNFSPIPETEAINIDPALLGVINLWQEHILTELEVVKSAVEAELISLLRFGGKEKERVRGLAAIALGYIGTEVSRVQVREALLVELKRSRPNQFVAWCVTDALSQIKHEAVEQAAIKLYQQHQSSPDEIGQQRCVYAVYLLGGMVGRFEETAKILYEALDSAHMKIRGYAAFSLGRLGPIEARERLEERLASRNPEKREQNLWVLRRMVEALGRVGTLESIRVLEPYLRHEQRRTRQRVREAITEIRRRYELI
jgi:hypothetical protein